MNPLAILSGSGPALQGGVVVPAEHAQPGTPFAFFSNWVQGGFLVVDAGVAKALARKGFSVVEHDLEPGERAWLVAVPGVAGTIPVPVRAWFAACPTGASVDAAGLPACGAVLPSGMREIPTRPGVRPSALVEGAVGNLVLERAARLAPPGSTLAFRYFGGNPVSSPEMRAKARAALAVYDRLVQDVDQVDAWRKSTRAALSPDLGNALAVARAWLAVASPAVATGRISVGPLEPPADPAKKAPDSVGAAADAADALIERSPGIPGGVTGPWIVVPVFASRASAVAGLGLLFQQGVGQHVEALLHDGIQPVLADLSRLAAHGTPTQRVDAKRALSMLRGVGGTLVAPAPTRSPFKTAVTIATIAAGALAGAWLLGAYYELDFLTANHLDRSARLGRGAA